MARYNTDLTDEELCERFLNYMVWVMEPVPYQMAGKVLQMMGTSPTRGERLLKGMCERRDIRVTLGVRYFGGKQCALNPIAHLKILSKWDEKCCRDFEQYPMPRLGWIGGQTYKFRDIMLRWAKTGEYEEFGLVSEYESQPVILSLLRVMPYYQQWIGFYSKLPAALLADLIDDSVQMSINSLMGLDRILENVYCKNELLLPAIAEYANEVFSIYNYVFSERIDEIPGHVTDFSAPGMCAHAFYAQYHGDYAEAVKRYGRALKLQEKSTFFQNPFYMFTYVVALIREGSVASINKLTQLNKKKDLRENKIYISVEFLIRMALDQDVTGLYQWVSANYDWQLQLNKLLIATVVKHYELGKIEYQIPEYCMTDERAALLKKLDTLLPPYHKLSEWERALEKLDSLVESDDNKVVVSDSRSRIVYHIDRHRQIIPRLQKSKDGINWTKGRNIALLTFRSKQLSEMTDLDNKVADCVKCYSGGYSIGDIYELGGAKAFSLLAGYPWVYMDENPDIPVVITKEEPQLIISKVDNGYQVTTNVEQLGTSSEVLIKENDQLYRVIEMDSTQRSILGTFKKTSVFPKEAKEKLAGLLGKLGKCVTVHSDLIQNKENLKQIKGDSLITVQLQPVGEGIKVELFVKPFVDQPPYCKAGEGASSVVGTVKGKRVQAMRNLQKERENLTMIQKLLVQVSGDETVTDIAYFDDYYHCLDLIEILRTQTKISRTEWPEGAKMNIKSVADFSQLNLSLKGVGYWFEVEGELETEDGVRIQIAELLKKIRESKGRFIALNDSDFLALSKQLRQRLGEFDAMMMNDKKLKVSSFNVPLLTDMEQLGVSLKKDKKFTELQKRIEQAGSVRVDLPVTLQAELRNYQYDGFQWMSQLAHWGAGACLADDMGLGKTVQAIALMLSRAKLGASLVVAPASVLMNWQNEIKRFAPSLTCHILHDVCGDREKMVQEASEFDVLLTTYGLLISEDKLLATKQWNIVLLDEAHTIKNKDTKMSKAAMTLNGEFRLLLTGTPIQNHLSEIWNLFQFANPGLLGAFSHFNEQFILPIEKAGDKQRQKQLKKILQPFMLRRTKTEVLDELPQKTEIIHQVELSPEEKALYESLRQQAICNLEEGTITPMQTLAEITKLRQAACHPALVNSQLNLSSSKTQAFLELVEELIQNHHRALVFSQFTSHLALICKELDERGLSYLYLDGSVPVNMREKLVRTFQQGEVPLFLISLKAGGTGLNLTAADYVFHLDPWWNPAVEDQASDRAYRIGQTRPVTIYRLIAMQTIEEKIMELHQSKKSLADSLLDGSNMAHKLTKEDMLQLLKAKY